VAVRPPLALPCLVLGCLGLSWIDLDWLGSGHLIPCLALPCLASLSHNDGTPLHTIIHHHSLTHSFSLSALHRGRPSLTPSLGLAPRRTLLLSALHRGAHSFSRPCTEAHHSHDHTPPLTPSLGLDPTPHSLCVPPSLRTARDADGTWQGLTLGSQSIRTGFGCSSVRTGVTVS